MKHEMGSKVARLLLTLMSAVVLTFGLSATALANADNQGGDVYAPSALLSASSDDAIDISSATKVMDGFYQSGSTYAASTDFYITNKEGLEYFRNLVSACDEGVVVDAYTSAQTNLNATQWYQGNPFQGKTVHLLADIDLENEDWTPIGYTNTAYYSGASKTQFYGNFDGHGHIISNLKLVGSSANYFKNGYGAYGLFGSIGSKAGQTFSNLTIENVSGVTGSGTWDYVGAIVGNAGSNAVSFVGCHIIGTISLSGSYEVGGIYGVGKGTLTDCSTEATGTIASDYYAAGLAGCARSGGVVVSGCAVSRVTISAPYAGALTSLNRVGGPDKTSNATFSNNAVSEATISGTDSAGIDDCWGTRVATGEAETVVSNVAIPITGLAITGSKETLLAGEKLQLGVFPVPEATTETLVTPVWESSDTDVVTVSDTGLVAVVGAGSATITVTAGDYSATYDITVKGVAKVIDVDGETVVGAYETLAEAIAVATTGQAIVLDGGAFDLPATAVIAQNVTIAGAGAAKTTLTIITDNGDGVKLANSGITIKDVTIDGKNIADGGYNSLVNVKADGCVISNATMVDGGTSSWNSSILVESLSADQTFKVENSTINGSYCGVLRESCNANIVINNCDITATYPFNIDGGEGGTVVSTGPPECTEGCVSLKIGNSGDDKSSVFKIGARIDITDPEFKSETESGAVYTTNLKLFNADGTLVYESQAQEITLVKGENLTAVSDIDKLGGVVKSGLAAVGPMATDVTAITLDLVIEPGAATADSYEYEVTPVTVAQDADGAYLAHTGTSETAAPYPVENDALHGSFSFNLSVSGISGAAKDDLIKVTHRSEDDEYADTEEVCRVREQGDACYVEVETDHFPTFTLEKIEPVHATGLSLDPETTQVEPGATIALDAALTPVEATDEVVWSSDDEEVATVDAHGTVTAVANGLATITAKAGAAASARSTICVIDIAGVTGLAFTGEDQALVTVSEMKNATVQYAFGADDATVPAEGWSDSAPIGNNAGDYYVWYKVVGDGNHNDVAADNVTVSIGKAVMDPQPTVSIKGWTAGDEPNEPVLFGNVSDGAVVYEYKQADASDDEYTSVVPTLPGDYVVRATIAPGKNYEGCTVEATFTLAVSEGNIETDVVVADGTPATQVSNMNEVANDVMDDDEKTRVQEGESARIWLAAESLPEGTVPAEDRSALEQAMEDAGATMGAYLDLSLFKQVGDSVSVEVHETSVPVKFSVAVPDELINTDPTITRTFKLLRVHDGKVDVLAEGTGSVLTGESDRFSTYGIAFVDAKKTDTTDNQDDSGKTDNQDDSGKTDDQGKADNANDKAKSEQDDGKAESSDVKAARAHKEAAKGNSGKSAAKTGDSLPVVPLLVVTAVAGVAAAFALTRRKNEIK